MDKNSLIHSALAGYQTLQGGALLGKVDQSAMCALRAQEATHLDLLELASLRVS